MFHLTQTVVVTEASDPYFGRTGSVVAECKGVTGQLPWLVQFGAGTWAWYETDDLRKA